VNPKQLALLKVVLDDYCAANGVTAEQDRDEIAASILRLFDRGLFSTEQITAALDDMAAGDRG